MKVELENVKPMDIEKRSFEIITEELGDKKLVIYEMTGHTAGSVCIWMKRIEFCFPVTV